MPHFVNGNEKLLCLKPLKQVKRLSQRIYHICPSCSFKTDIAHNAVINILKLGGTVFSFCKIEEIYENSKCVFDDNRYNIEHKHNIKGNIIVVDQKTF